MSSKPKPNSVKVSGEHGLVPKLRFPAFRSAPAWDLKRGDALFDAINNRSATPGLPVLAITQEHGAIPRDHIDYHVSATAASIATYKEVCVGDFIISLRTFQGGIEYSRFHGICSPAYVILRRKGAGSDDYFRHLFKSARFIQQLNRNIEGLRDGKMISYAQFAEQLLPVSEPAEQEKISDCLNSLDELIAARAHKLDALRSHKQGLTQHLFPQVGETVPRIRFPEFHDGPAWEEKSLGPMTDRVGSGVTPLGGDKNYKSTGRPFIRSQNIGWCELLLDDVAYIDEDTHRTFDATELAISDVLLNITGASIGRCAVADHRIVGGNVNQHVCIIRLKPNALVPHILSQFLVSDRGQTQIDSFQAGGNRQGLNFAQIRSLVIPTPPTIAEQQQIANCLGSVDAAIAAAAAALDALKTFKNGLRQALFPRPEEPS